MWADEKQSAVSPLAAYLYNLEKVGKYLQIQETVRIELIATAIGLVYFICEEMAIVEKNPGVGNS